jgi:hypothetical protein
MRNCFIPIICLGLCLAGCTKYLDTKPNQSLAIPSSIKDVQALLDAYFKLNNTDPGSSEVSADNYYLTTADWQALTEPYRRMYTWEKDYVFSGYPNDWSNVYANIFTCNTVLDNMDKIEKTPANTADWNNGKGSALFFRAKGFLQAAIIWGGSYSAATGANTLGIPLRTGSDFNVPSVRANLQETFSTIIADLKQAASLLPVTPAHLIRPSRAAAYALLARAYMAMGSYDSCGVYANACLQLRSTLLDYNTLNTTATYPFSQFNAEVIHESMIPVPTPINNVRAKIDPVLYASYAANDLRKVLFFKNNGNGTNGFKGSYEGGGNLFGGIATDEVYLMRAEAYARAGNTTAALQDLNTLLQTRWKAGTFVPFSAATATDALQLVLLERRKELLMRGLRWMDIKRLNAAGSTISLARNINGQVYSLPPNDLRFALAIPEDVIALSGIIQNPR